MVPELHAHEQSNYFSAFKPVYLIPLLYSIGFRDRV